MADSPIGENVRSIMVDVEQIEVTRAGILPPFKADVCRRFVAGVTYVYVTLTDGTELPPMTREEYEAWATKNG